MDAELKAKWVEALRSGEYQQGKYSLRNHNGAYCCMGVLAEINGIMPDKNQQLVVNSVGTKRIPDDWNGLYYVLEADCGVSREYQETLSGLNDNGKPFSEIADYIEANL